MNRASIVHIRYPVDIRCWRYKVLGGSGHWSSSPEADVVLKDEHRVHRVHYEVASDVAQHFDNVHRWTVLAEFGWDPDRIADVRVGDGYGVVEGEVDVGGSSLQLMVRPHPQPRRRSPAGWRWWGSPDRL
jgi:hypothetical protein